MTNLTRKRVFSPTPLWLRLLILIHLQFIWNDLTFPPSLLSRLSNSQGINIQISGTTAILVIANVTEEDYGNYTCVAANRLGVQNASLFLYSKYGQQLEIWIHNWTRLSVWANPLSDYCEFQGEAERLSSINPTSYWIAEESAGSQRVCAFLSASLQEMTNQRLSWEPYETASVILTEPSWEFKNTTREGRWHVGCGWRSEVLMVLSSPKNENSIIYSPSRRWMKFHCRQNVSRASQRNSVAAFS